LCVISVYSDGYASCDRYIPLRRIQVPLSSENQLGADFSFPSISSCDEIDKAGSSSLIQCKFGSIKAVAKVCTLESLVMLTL
jgi:hypothetical protein